MTPDERQALRETHAPMECPSGQYCRRCSSEIWEDYPCDVIKVLDELERWIKE